MAANRPPQEIDSRAEEHGRLIKEKRLDLGLNRPAFVAEMNKHGQEITPDYLNKLERGTAPLSRASLEVRETIRVVLGYNPEEWYELTGLYTPAAVITMAPAQPMSAAFAASAQYGNIPLEEDEVDEALLEAAREYGDKAGFEGLADPVTQRALQSIDFRQRPATPEEWLSKFLKFRDELRSSHDA